MKGSKKKKLTLDRETLRTLSGTVLSAIHGGQPATLVRCPSDDPEVGCPSVVTCRGTCNLCPSLGEFSCICVPN